MDVFCCYRWKKNEVQEEMLKNVGRIRNKLVHPERMSESFTFGANPCYISIFPLTETSHIKTTNYQKKNRVLTNYVVQELF